MAFSTNVKIVVGHGLIRVAKEALLVLHSNGVRLQNRHISSSETVVTALPRLSIFVFWSRAEGLLLSEQSKSANSQRHPSVVPQES